MAANKELLGNLGSLYFWLVTEEVKENEWLDWLIGSEIIHTRINLRREAYERSTDSNIRTNSR